MRTSTAPRASHLVQLQKHEDRLGQVPEPSEPGKGGSSPDPPQHPRITLGDPTGPGWPWEPGFNTRCPPRAQSLG